jgi:glutamate synthase domain-containing protein 2
LSDRGVDVDWRPSRAAGGGGRASSSDPRRHAHAVGLVLESGEPREVHHFSLLIGYGAGAINPYVAFETLDDMIRQGLLVNIDHKEGVQELRQGGGQGRGQGHSKMGISTIQSYRGAQIFEAIGLHPSVVEKYFTGTASRVGGVGLDVIARKCRCATTRRLSRPPGQRPRFGRRRPVSMAQATASIIFSIRRRSTNSSPPAATPITRPSRNIRSGQRPVEKVLHLARPARIENRQPTPVPIEEVEPVEAIVKRFKSGAMSYGSISKEAHEALAIAMNRIGGKSNTGEGGEDPARYTRTQRRFQEQRHQAGRLGPLRRHQPLPRQREELQIKMAQGAKPGEGGQLPGGKVYPWIAKVAHATPGVGLISPPPHHDIYSIEDLAELIHDLKNANRTRASASSWWPRSASAPSPPAWPRPTPTSS